LLRGMLQQELGTKAERTARNQAGKQIDAESDRAKKTQTSRETPVQREAAHGFQNRSPRGKKKKPLWKSNVGIRPFKERE